jgi:hypothetical protein
MLLIYAGSILKYVEAVLDGNFMYLGIHTQKNSQRIDFKLRGNWNYQAAEDASTVFQSYEKIADETVESIMCMQFIVVNIISTSVRKQESRVYHISSVKEL